MTEPSKQVKKWNPNPTGKGGFQDHPELRNNGGRPRNPLKEYQRERFSKMSEKEKEEFLKKVAPELRWRMAEGNPDTTTDITSGGEPLVSPEAISKAQAFDEWYKQQLKGD